MPDKTEKGSPATAAETPRINPERLRRLFRRMVDIYSPSGKEEDLSAFLYGMMKRNGLPVVRQAVSEDRDNLLVEPDSVDAELVFVGHLDTILAYDLDQYSFRQEDDLVYGLGTADMKGGCAAMVEAWLTLWEKGHYDLPVALALVVGEEETGDGAQRLVRDADFSAAIIGEPTDMQPCLSHFGYLETHLWTEGRLMHASMAPRTRSAVNSMLNLLLRITNHLQEKRPDIIYNIRDLASSRRGFAVPDSCEAWIDLHVPPLTPLGELTVELEELVEAERKSHKSFVGDVDFSTIHAGYSLPEKGALVSTIRQVCEQNQLPFSSGAFPSHSDANVLWQAGIKPIVMGPGLLEDAHTPEEHTSMSQVLKAAQFYVDLALSYKTRY